MTPEQWQQIEEIFHCALACAPEKRTSFLGLACDGDEDLRREVDLLLNANDEGDERELLCLDNLMAAAITDRIDGPMIGRTLGHYRLDKLLGSGGMGDVYLAHDISLKRAVALKLLPSHFTIDPDRVLRFELEAQAASALNHPNIITIYDIGESKAGRYIVMELVEGRTLSSLDKPCEMGKLVFLGGQIAKALSATHAAGITHRDIKPDNIMIRNDGYVKILDFGLARLNPATMNGTEAITMIHQTTPGALLGTVAYMSPEQACGEAADTTSDIFALGIVFYELATDEHPFRADKMLDQLLAIRTQAPKPPSRLRPDMPARLESLILRMLEKEPHLRPKAEEVVHVIEGLAGMINSGAHPLFSSLRVNQHLVGRDNERRALRNAYNSARNGHGMMLCLTGEPGIGKTSLVEVFLAELGAEGQCTIARGHCSRRLAGRAAYRPLLEALGNLIRDGSNPAASRVLKQIAPTWYVQVDPLSGRDEETSKLLADLKTVSPERMKRELYNFLQEVARLRPLVLFFDDLQWTDISTIEMLSFLSDKFEGQNILVIATHPSSYLLQHGEPLSQIMMDLESRRLCRELKLVSLRKDEIAGYLELEFPGHRFPPGFSELIHMKTEGHPLFMSDLVTYLRDRHVIAREEGLLDTGSRWVLSKSLKDIEADLPVSVSGMIQCRIGQLDELDRKLLVAASVRGSNFESAVVAKVVGIEIKKVEERMARLEADNLFVRLIDEYEFSGGTLTRRYRFIHKLYKNTLLRSMKASRKVVLHRTVAQAMMDLYGERSETVANELAALLEAGRDYVRAAEFYRLSAEIAVRVNANQEAIQLVRQGLKMLAKAPDTTSRGRLELALLITLADPLAATAGLNSAEFDELYTGARKLARQLGESTQISLTLH